MKSTFLVLWFLLSTVVFAANSPMIFGPTNSGQMLVPNILFVQGAGTPTAVPPVGYDFLYFKNDDNLYAYTHAGVETLIGGGGGGGSVTSVGLALPVSVFSVSGSPVINTGTLTGSFINQSANTIFAGPTLGAATTPAFRALVAADIPGLDASKIISGILPHTFGGTDVAAVGADGNVLTASGGFWISAPPSGGGGSGTVTSVAQTVPVEFSIAGSPVTTSGTLAITKANENSHTVWAGPNGGGPAQPTFRALVVADIPALPYVTSVDQAVPVEFSVSGNPITSSGTITITKANEVANTVWAGPNGGGPAQPTFRALVAADIPALTYVTSVDASVPVEFTISGNPITSAGTLAISKANETANTVWAGPTLGAAAQPTFRALVAADIPALPYLFDTDGLYALKNTANPTKLQKWDLSGQTTGTTTTFASLSTQNESVRLQPLVDATGNLIVQNGTSGQIFIGANASIGASNSGIQYSDATTANRGQIKLHSYFNGASIAGVSTLTSRSGTVGVNNAVVAGQDYSKWTAQAGATTVGSAPISGTFAFKANTVNALTVTSDYHIALTNLAGTLGDRLYLGSEGALQLPFYSTGIMHSDATGNLTSSAVNLASGDVSGVLPFANMSSTPTFVNYWVDGSRTDIYTQDGTINRPYKTVMGCINRIIANGDNSLAKPYQCNMYGSQTYAENIILEDALLTDIYLNCSGVPGSCEINPAIGNSLQSSANNDVLHLLRISGLTFDKPVVLTNGGGQHFLQDSGFCYDCTFNDIQTLSNAGDWELWNSYVEGDISLGGVDGSFLFINDANGTAGVALSSGSIAALTGGVLTGNMSVDATSTLILRGGIRAGSSGGSLTIDGLVQAYSSFIRSDITVNSGGTFNPRGTFWNGTLTVNVGGTYTNENPSSEIGYAPATPGDWSPAPSFVNTALDQLAARSPLSSVLTSAHIFVGNGSNVATDVAVSGDISLSNTGAMTINNLSVTNAKIANGTIDLTTKVTGILPSANGGTGVNNAGSLTYGANNITLTTSGVTALTLPTSGIVAVTNVAQTFSAIETFSLPLTMAQNATPANPAATFDKLYFKNDDKLYGLNSAGVEVLIGPTAAGSGTVTSVDFADASGTPIYAVSGNPVTTSGTLTITLNTQTANKVFAGPATAGPSQPTFRSLVAADIPALPYASSTLTSAHIFVGNGGNVATDVAVSGDLTLANTGAFTIANLAVTNAKIANGTIDLTTKVTGALPIANGGTGQTTKTAAFDALSPGTTKGDLIAFDGTNNVRLAVGTNGQVLSADSTQATGLKWVAAGGGGGSSGTTGVVFTQSGGVSIMDDFGNPYPMPTSGSLSSIDVGMLNAGVSGNTLITVNQFRAGSLFSSATASIPGNGGLPFAGTISLSGTLTLATDDLLTVDINGVATGAPQNLSIAMGMSAGSLVGNDALLGIGAASATNVVLSLKDGHIKSSQTTAPVATVNANAGTGATCTVSNATDIAGHINLTTTAVAPAAGAQCSIAFNKAYNVAPICMESAGNNNSVLFAVANGVFFTTTTTTLVINYANADAVGHANVFNFNCVETQ